MRRVVAFVIARAVIGDAGGMFDAEGDAGRGALRERRAEYGYGENNWQDPFHGRSLSSDEVGRSGRGREIDGPALALIIIKLCGGANGYSYPIEGRGYFVCQDLREGRSAPTEMGGACAARALNEDGELTELFLDIALTPAAMDDDHLAGTLVDDRVQ